MGCRSDYMEPTQFEIENSKVLALLEELKTNILPNYYGDGSFHKVYGLSNQSIVDKNTKKLCTLLQKKKDISKMSLEMQLWWRDHQALDKKRITEELAQKKTEKAKQTAIAKLTPLERELLGL